MWTVVAKATEQDGRSLGAGDWLTAPCRLRTPHPHTSSRLAAETDVSQ